MATHTRRTLDAEISNLSIRLVPLHIRRHVLGHPQVLVLLLTTAMVFGARADRRMIMPDGLRRPPSIESLHAGIHADEPTATTIRAAPPRGQ